MKDFDFYYPIFDSIAPCSFNFKGLNTILNARSRILKKRQSLYKSSMTKVVESRLFRF